MGLDLVELVMAFEEKFGVSIPDAEANELTTPREVTDYLMRKNAVGGRSREEVARIVRQVIEEQCAVYDFTEDSRFVDDMHLD
ncbi:MAG TPA: phosphopantetheine-binding protein [Pyrinomonadaceae bacterium]|nr:phosphopantetheine-binding protein [Pyrinomonadaceae bacterium]